MLYNSTKILLLGILQSLESGDEAVWDDHVESAKECLYEMFQMTGPGATASSKPHTCEKLTRAIPHMKLMLRAIRDKDQITAMAHGKAALAEM
jgi:hypothetical protein